MALFDQGIIAYEQEASKDGFVNDVAGVVTFFIGSATSPSTTARSRTKTD